MASPKSQPRSAAAGTTTTTKSAMTASTKIHPFVTHSKLITAVVAGLIFGWYNLQGGNTLVGYMSLANFFGILTATFVGVDEEAVGGKYKIMLEGVMPSTALFVLIWTATSNLMHGAVTVAAV
ncbi:hypothetical protein AMAG_09306 [Allomyces macrogynus ATCC 38327]|uniref:ER membrane protein complex subunit 6 n=1 Tax=Allomyces macrogynus (strain ATCC 38327) TaxID=578462 RepID=A0A0L0SPE5_ALLM3|nr:hypothetical protein AMAG_09306 [Allomyces macrogynus ATCC 38327]|eukprot:KNE64274.1 hypothetical protein AMAG_09306 [Allomyces macrogynus ATCC 38327]